MALERVLLVLAALLSAACSSSSVTTPEGEVTVTGTVVAIADATPVDGGVTISLAIEGGVVETLHFASLFTFPPPEPDRLALYERIQRAEVGSRARATGVRTADGIDLTDFEVLSGAAAITASSID